MNAERELSAAYDEWRRLAEAEGQAIQTCNWSLLSACQNALKTLQQRCSELSELARGEWKKLGPTGIAKQKKLNATIHELVALEHRNGILLKAIRESAQEKLEQLGDAGRNLKRIQRTYSGESTAAWISFC
jgi:hypothetical protein